MRWTLGFFIVLLMFVGCEPSYRVYIRNSSSSDVYFKTSPSIESLYDSTLSPFYYRLIFNYKINNDGKYSVYRLRPFDSLLLYGHIGGLNVNDVPFDYIEIISNNDTTILESKSSIIDQLKAMYKKGNYYIEAKK